jgi:hypothetical protein
MTVYHRGVVRGFMPNLAVDDRLLRAGKVVGRAARCAGLRTAGALMVLGLTAMLGACSKCDVPTPWEHGSLGSTPAACHAAPQPD